MAIFTQLNKVWRLIGTGLAFVIFGLGGLILGNLWFALLRLFYKAPDMRRKASQRSISFCFRAFVKSLKFLKIIDYKIEGAEILQQDQGCLLIANHPTILDYVLIGSVLPEMDCVVKEALFHNPFCRTVVRCASYIPNSADPEKLLEACKERLKNGGKFLIFPEGTRTPMHATELKLQRGAANLAIRCEVPMRVIHICCEPISLNRSMPWYKVPEIKSFFYIKVQQLESITPYLEESIPPSKAVRRLNNHLTHILKPSDEMVAITRSLSCKH